jgi:hypothetical protein
VPASGDSEDDCGEAMNTAAGAVRVHVSEMEHIYLHHLSCLVFIGKEEFVAA